MTQPRTIDNCQDVDSLQDFVAYLRLLAADARHAESASRPWPNATIPEFLGSVATLLAGSKAAAGEAGPAMSEWSQLAVLLREAQAGQPATLPADAGQNADAKAVDSVEGLLAYLRWLIEDCRRDSADAVEHHRSDDSDTSGRWAHRALPSWVEAWASWLEDCYLKPHPAMMIQLG